MPNFTTSNGNSTVSLDEHQWQDPSTLLALLAVFLLAISLVANVLITLAIARYPKLRTNFNFYLLNIALSDIFFAIFAASNFFTSVFFFHGYFPFDYSICTFWLYSDWMFSAATENTMMLVSLDRLVCVYWPITYRNHQSSRYSAIILSMMWIWLHCLILPTLLWARLHSTKVDTGICEIDYQIHLHLMTSCVMLVFWLPEAITVIAYTLIAVKMRQKSVGNGPTQRESKYHRRRRYDF